MTNINQKDSERSQIKALIQKIYDGTINIENIKADNVALYIQHRQELDTAQKMFYLDKTESPKWRFNFLIAGDGGTGKSTLAQAIADELKEKAFTFTDVEAGFNEYINQNFILWDEMRSDYIKTKWGIARFLSATNNSKVNDAFIKVLYGVVKLQQHYNFITTSENPREFLEGLTERSYEDVQRTQLSKPENPDQISRRFNYFIETKLKQIDKDTQEWTYTLYEYDPMETNWYTFFDKYKAIKTWTLKNITRDNYESKVKPIAKIIADNINKTKLTTKNIIEKEDDLSWLNEGVR